MEDPLCGLIISQNLYIFMANINCIYQATKLYRET